jgi:hypothetical protein
MARPPPPALDLTLHCAVRTLSEGPSPHPAQAIDTFLAKEELPVNVPLTPAEIKPSLTLIKRSSSAQAPTRTKRYAHSSPLPLPTGVPRDHTPPTSLARQPRRPHNDLLLIITVGGDPGRDSIPRLGPYTSLVPPTSPWNTHGKYMNGVHTHTRAAISPTLFSLERYNWLQAAHSRLHNTTDFTQDLLRIMPRYHFRAKSLNPQGRSLNLANH